MSVAAGVPPAGRNEYFTGIEYSSGTGVQDVWRASVNWATSAISWLLDLTNKNIGDEGAKALAAPPLVTVPIIGTLAKGL